jgi:4-diphosphocytidyl-2C-methyl-D-erythritol kinase
VTNAPAPEPRGAARGVHPVVVDAPAKINFGLRIVARRPDGYHNIDTVMLPLDLCDRLSVAHGSRPGIHLQVEGAELPLDLANLASRGAAAACRALGLEPRLELRLEKRIPVAAGLGGGTSDAAAALRAVETLAGKTLPPGQRFALARSLGADVPFFLDPRPVRARGIGDELEPLDEIPELAWLLVALPFPVLTGEVYAAAGRELTLPRVPSSMPALSALALLACSSSEGSSRERSSREGTHRVAVVGAGRSHESSARGSSGPGGSLPPLCTSESRGCGSEGRDLASPENDLERVTGRRHPEVGEAQRVLRGLGARVTGMSGSGPTVYGNFASCAVAQAALAQAVLPAGARAWVAMSPPSACTEPSWGVAKR